MCGESDDTIRAVDGCDAFYERRKKNPRCGSRMAPDVTMLRCEGTWAVLISCGAPNRTSFRCDGEAHSVNAMETYGISCTCLQSHCRTVAKREFISKRNRKHSPPSRNQKSTNKTKTFAKHTRKHQKKKHLVQTKKSVTNRNMNVKTNEEITEQIMNKTFSLEREKSKNNFFEKKDENSELVVLPRFSFRQRNSFFIRCFTIQIDRRTKIKEEKNYNIDSERYWSKHITQYRQQQDRAVAKNVSSVTKYC